MKIKIEVEIKNNGFIGLCSPDCEHRESYCRLFNKQLGALVHQGEWFDQSCSDCIKAQVVVYNSARPCQDRISVDEVKSEMQKDSFAFIN